MIFTLCSEGVSDRVANALEVSVLVKDPKSDGH